MTTPPLSRDKLVLATMSAAGTRALSPVQVQKLFFILDQEAFSHKPFFQFKPYDYGPFDDEVYRAIEGLGEDGFTETSTSGPYGLRSYRLTDDGLDQGRRELGELARDLREYIQGLVGWIMPLIFGEIVSYIYETYPHMKENSVFQER